VEWISWICVFEYYSRLGADLPQRCSPPQNVQISNQLSGNGFGEQNESVELRSRTNIACCPLIAWEGFGIGRAPFV
jgi:hypothetical protein